MSKSHIARRLLRLTAVASFAVASIWYKTDPSWEPLLAILGGFAALIASCAIPDKRGGIRMKSVKAGRNVEARDRTGGGIDMRDVDAGVDVIAREDQGDSQ